MIELSSQTLFMMHACMTLLDQRYSSEVENLLLCFREASLSNMSQHSGENDVYKSNTEGAGHLVRDILYGTRHNVNFIHEVFRQAFLLSFSHSPAMKRVITVYKDWIQMNVQVIERRNCFCYHQHHIRTQLTSGSLMMPLKIGVIEYNLFNCRNWSA